MLAKENKTTKRKWARGDKYCGGEAAEVGQGRVTLSRDWLPLISLIRAWR